MMPPDVKTNAAQGAGAKVASPFPQALLFICTNNAIRSVIAAHLYQTIAPKGHYVASAGVKTGDMDPFVWAVMDEMGIDVADHVSRSLDDLDDTTFDMIISLSPEAHHHAMELTRTMAVEVIYWPTLNPAIVHGNREQRLSAYRECRDFLKEKIMSTFSVPDEAEK